MTRHAEIQAETEEPPEPTTVGIAGLLLPFVVVVIAAVLLGARTLQLEWTLVLLAVPIAIIALRRASAHTHAPRPLASARGR